MDPDGDVIDIPGQQIARTRDAPERELRRYEFGQSRPGARWGLAHVCRTAPTEVVRFGPHVIGLAAILLASDTRVALYQSAAKQ